MRRALRLTQPDNLGTFDLGHPLLYSLQNAFVGTTSGRLINLAKMASWSITGPHQQVLTPSGSGFQVDSTHYVTSVTAAPPATPGWTIAAIIMPTSAATSGDIAGFAQTAGSTTFDRTLSISVGSSWKGMLFDGGTKQIATSFAPVIGRVDTLVVTGSPTTLSIYGNNSPVQTLAVANSGFQGYSATPVFCVGNASSSPGAGVAVLHCLQLNRVWSAYEVKSWIQQPWQTFKTPSRRYLPGFTAAGAPSTGWGLLLNTSRNRMIARQ